MIDWLNVFKHLLPNARAWRITIEKQLRQFFQGLTGIGEDAKTFLDNVYEDLDPQKTRELDAWEKQFALEDTGLSDAARRDRLDATWKALGGQSPRYIQDTLQAAGFNVFVHEWWVPSVAQPTGGAIAPELVLMACGEPLAECGELVAEAGNILGAPVARNPFTYLWDGVSPREFIGSGHDLAFCGGDSLFSNSQIDPPGYPLVNKILQSVPGVVGCAHVELMSGGDNAASGVTVFSNSFKQFVIPADPTKYPFFLYIGGETFPDVATVPLSRKDEFETLCLKICPTEQWLGILVNYT